MPENGPVSLKIQTIFCLIPFLDLYATYRIKKLRKYLVIIIVFVSIPLLIISDVLIPSIHSERISENIAGYIASNFGIWIIEVLIAIYLIRRWSVQWNKAFEINSY